MTPTTLSRHEVQQLLHHSRIESLITVLVVSVIVVIALFVLDSKLRKEGITIGGHKTQD